MQSMVEGARWPAAPTLALLRRRYAPASLRSAA